MAEPWMRDATRAFATGRTGDALAAYGQAGMVHAAETRDAARAALIDRWDTERRAEPTASRIILTHMNKEVEMLNDAARDRLAKQGVLGPNIAVRTERGQRQFADNDRILFFKNERELGVKKGTLCSIEKAATDSMAVRLDDGRRVVVNLKSYAHVDHGYAATVHKTQGMTVDRTQVLATPELDAHATYVAMSRHRDGTALHYGRDDFADEQALRRTLARERPKDMALDYETRGSALPPSQARPAAGMSLSGNSSAGREEGRGFVFAVRRALGMAQPERAAAMESGREGQASATKERQVVSTSRQPDGATQASETNHGKRSAAANSDRAKEIRAMVATRVTAPRPTAESMRQALTAAKAMPQQDYSYDQDHGAER